MIAVVSSTIFPPSPECNSIYRSTINPSERLKQTQETVKSLIDLRIEDIYIADNSGINWESHAEETLLPAKLFRQNTFQFNHKGISELYLLLSIIPYLPENVPILKISGRYKLSKIIDENKLKEKDFAGKFSEKTISTRCYYVKDRSTFRSVLIQNLEIMYRHSSKIIGPKSLLKFLNNYLSTNYFETKYLEPQLMIEKSMYMCIKNGYRYYDIPELGVSGYLAGSKNASTFINE